MIRSLVLSHVVAFSAIIAANTALGQAAQPHQPYAGLEAREVKALSDQQIADLREGRGMGLALAAELNGYPGPRHVLEHADAMNLTPAQREQTQKLFDAMKSETVRLGGQLIEQEAELDHLFASKTIMPESLETATGAIAQIQGALRAAHLRYHLAMMEVLTPEQVRTYGELRGYAGGHGQMQHEHGHGAHAN